MAHPYPIWNEVKNCTYNSNKSYGNKETGVVNIYVGSSPKNSKHLVKTIVTKRLTTYKGKGVFAFRFSVDDIVLKAALFENNKGVPGKFIKTISKMKKIKSLNLD